MGRFFCFGLMLGVLTLGITAEAQPLRRPIDLSSDAARQATVNRLQAESQANRTAAEAVVNKYGGPIKGKTPSGADFALVGLKDGRPMYFSTGNANAAISTAANLIRNVSPYNVDGAGFTEAIWDGGTILGTHQELTGRVNILDPVATASHATHVAGTIAASGVAASALGMAPAATLDSYDWDDDLAEMAAAAAVTPAQSGRVALSNHSYGYITGWSTGNWSGSTGPHWFGSWGQREDSGFGTYDAGETGGWDDTCYNAPYYLPFKSSGNDRSDSAPASGTTFYYWNGSAWASKAYAPATDPYADGWDNGGFDTMELRACAKNVMTVGAVNDAVNANVRSLPNATMSSFSCWGPVDDGRIKPDIVANGVAVYSSVADSTSSYAYYNGTSMATPNASGSALLLINYYADLFPGSAMRASMLKGLIIHTADDLGNAGPDYRNGWGLMNTKAAADVIAKQHDNPLGQFMITGLLNGADSSDAYTVRWDGASPIRATLCWTDPAGPGVTGLDTSTPMLVNDLDLRIVSPGGSITYLPFILDRTNPASLATTGDNVVDNVEQVYIASLGNEGTYTVQVTHKGTLTGSEQYYSLIITGQNPEALAITPDTGFTPAGPLGGPFTDTQTYTLTNASSSSLSWSVSTAASWLTFSQASGTLTGNASTTVQISLNATAHTLTAGEHTATVVFTNTTIASTQDREVQLTVRPPQTFTWSAIASPQSDTASFPVTITATDELGITTPGYTGSPALHAFIPSANLTISDPIGTWDIPLATQFEDARTQVIYLASELGPAKRLTGLALNIDTVQSAILKNWTIRIKPTSLTTYATASWESSGWTTAFHKDQVVSVTGWNTFNFSHPFLYDGTSNLIIDFSFNSDSTSAAASTCFFSMPGGTRTLFCVANSTFDDPLTWSGTMSPTPLTSSYVPDIQLLTETQVTMTPTSAGPFTNGVWTGSASIPTAAYTVHLSAEEPAGPFGDSNSFDVLPTPQITNVSSAHANGSFRQGETIDVQVTFSVPVIVSGMPSVLLETGATNREATYTGGGGSATLVFEYLVQTGDDSSDLDYVNPSALALNGGHIRDFESNSIDAIITLPEPGAANSLGANKSIIIDTTAPQAVCLSMDLYLDVNGEASLDPAAFGVNSTDNQGITQYLAAKTDFTCADLGLNSVTLTVKDAAGNQDQCQGDITLLDEIDPNAIAKNATVYLNSSGVATLDASQVNNGSTDNCGIQSITVAPDEFTCDDLGNQPVTLTVTDTSSNSDTKAATVTVVDALAPEAVCQDITLYLDAAGAATLLPTQIDGGSHDNCGIAEQTLSQDEFNCLDVGIHSVTLTVRDASLQEDSCSANVTIADNLPPTVHTQNITVYLNEDGEAHITAEEIDDGSTDNCAVSSRSVNPDTFTRDNLGDNNVTLTIEDIHGNQNTAGATVTVADAIAPTANISLLNAIQTQKDTLSFNVIFSEPIGSSFAPEDVELTGTLTGNVTLQGSGQDYTVHVALDEPDTDGTVGIRLGSGITDLAGNPLGLTTSSLYQIANWFGFSQTPGNVRHYTGEDLVFSVQPICSATTLSYQWWRDTGAKGTPEAIGDGSQDLLLAALDESDAGSYWCEVSYDGETYSTLPADVAIAERITIIIQPLGGSKIVGDSHQFTVETTGGFAPLSYHWMKNGEDLITTTVPEYTISALSIDDKGDYSVEVTDAYDDAETSDTVNLNVSWGVPALATDALLLLASLIGLTGAMRLHRRRA